MRYALKSLVVSLSTKSPKKQHVSEWKHECEFCLDGFEIKENMVDHRAGHKGKYNCNICDSQFKAYHKLILHLICGKHHPKFYRLGTIENTILENLKIAILSWKMFVQFRNLSVQA